MLEIRLKRKTDGGSAFTLVRADGSSTWQRQSRHAEHFAHHDLTHLAVESALGVDEGFYGLIARGWDFEDFDKPWPRGPLPDVAMWVEVIVGLLDVERASQAAGAEQLTPEQFQLRIAEQMRDAGRLAPRDVEAAALAEIRRTRAELFDRWWRVPAGEPLVLTFPYRA